MREPILICGPPRSGTTLLYCMLRYTVRNRLVVPQETVPGEGEIGKVVTALLKGPDGAIVCIRDPRAIISSVHSKPHFQGQYFIGATTSLKRHGLLEYFEGYRKVTNCVIVPYEHLILLPNLMRDMLGNVFGLEFKAGFEDFHKGQYGSECNHALNGLRPLDEGHDWRDHLERVEGEFQAHRELFEVMEAWNYGQSTDDPAWREICSRCPKWRGNPASEG